MVSSGGIATRGSLDGQGSNFGGEDIFRNHPERSWSPTNFLHNGYRAYFGVQTAVEFCWSPTPFGAEVANGLCLVFLLVPL